MFEITFIVCFIRQISSYFIYIDKYYVAFKMSLITICVFFIILCVVSIISTMINGKNIIIEHIGSILRVITGLLILGLLISYSKIIYDNIVT